MKINSFSIITFVVGILIGWILGCNSKPNPIQIIETEKIVYDTVTVPVPQTKYFYKNDTILKVIRDSFLREIVRNVPEDSLVPIPFNEYIDSIKSSDYVLKYKVQTFGEMVGFNYSLSFIPRAYIVPQKAKSWMVGVAVSDRLNYKCGVGYKGWTVETEFNKNLTFNQVYFGKQFYLK